MKNRRPTPDFVCDPSGSIFHVDKKITQAANKMLNLVQFLPNTVKSSDESSCKIKNRRTSPPNFVCDSSGSVFCLHKKRTRSVKKYILVSIFVNYNCKINANLEQIMTSHKPENHLEHHQMTPLHRKTIKQRQYTSKSWLIAIILKHMLVAWDYWTYRIGFKMAKANPPPGLSQN